MTKKWNIANDLSNANYNVGNEIIYSTEVLKYNFCDYNDSYILARVYITVLAAPTIQVSFKIVQDFLNVSQKLMEQQ